MLPDVKADTPLHRTAYMIGIVATALTIILSYVHFWVGKGMVQNVSIIDIGLNLVSLFIFRKYLLQYHNTPVITSMDWYLCIYAVIFLSPVFKLIIRNANSPEFKEVLEIMEYFDGLVYITFLVIGIQLGVRLRRLSADPYLKMFGGALITIIPALFLIKYFITYMPALSTNLSLHLVLSTIAQVPSLLLLMVLYRGMRGISPSPDRAM